MFLGNEGQQRGDGVLDVSHESHVDVCAAPDICRAQIDLNLLCLLRVEVGQREVRAEQQAQVAIVHRLVGATPAEQSGHPDRVRVSPLEPLLAAVRVSDRRLQLLGQRNDLVVRVATSVATEDRDRAGLVDHLGQSAQILIAGPQQRSG